MLGLDFLGHQKTFFKDCTVWENLCCYPGKAKGLPVALEFFDVFCTSTESHTIHTSKVQSIRYYFDT